MNFKLLTTARPQRKLQDMKVGHTGRVEISFTGGETLRFTKRAYQAINNSSVSTMFNGLKRGIRRKETSYSSTTVLGVQLHTRPLKF
mgnify:CR=1 FL=1